MTRYVDSMLRPVSVRDTIVYAAASGYSADLVRGVVLGETPQKLKVQPLSHRGWRFKQEDFRAPDYRRPNPTHIGNAWQNQKTGLYVLAAVMVLDNVDWPELEVFDLKGWLDA